MKYECCLADADGTLFNFLAGEKNALRETLAAHGLPYDENIAALYSRINLGHWKRLEQGLTTQKRLRVERFADFLAALREGGMDVPPIEPEQMALTFVDGLARQSIPMEGALAFVKAVSAHMPVVLVTNGISRVQHGRFDHCELKPYLKGLVISEELGVSKPDPAMIDAGMRAAGVTDKRRVVMLGDSLTADIAAANNAGVDSILFTDGAEPPEGHAATYAARTLAEAARIVLSQNGCLLGKNSVQ